MWKYWFHSVLSNTVLKWVILDFLNDTSWVFHFQLFHDCFNRWEIYFCHDKHLLWQNFCCNKIVFVTPEFSLDKRHVLSWQTCVCHSKSKFVVTKLLSRQNYVCHDKKYVCCSKVLSWQAYFCYDKRHILSWQICVCHGKSKLIVTKLLS